MIEPMCKITLELNYIQARIICEALCDRVKRDKEDLDRYSNLKFDRVVCEEMNQNFATLEHVRSRVYESIIPKCKKEDEE